MNVRAVIAIAAATLATGCSAHGESPPVAVTSTPAAAAAIGTPMVFAKKATGQRVGTFTVTDVMVVPAECLLDPPVNGKQTLGLRVEIVNDGILALPRPDMYSVKVQDAGGFTQSVETTTVRAQCNSRYPSIAASEAPGKTAGWAFIDTVHPNPTAVTYAPFAAEEGSSISDIKVAELSPPLVTIKLPAPLEPGPAATTAPTGAPLLPSLPAPQPVKPAAGQPCSPDTDNWATDAGGQLKCAFAGGPTAKWVRSAPFVGTKTPGATCELGAAVAESPTSETLVCVGERGSATWAPGP
jgi:hypothetical protein